MSTLASTAPRRGTRGHRVISGPLAAVFLAEFCALTSFDLLVSVTPGYAAAVGAGTAGAGLMTGALLLGTVAAELAASALMRRLGHRALLGAGALLLGVPALALLPRDGLAVIAAVSVVRGFGFGLGTVSSGALTALLLPPERRGEGLGLFGAAATAPGVIALPGGVWLAGHCGTGLVVVLAAATAVVPLAAFPRLPAEAGRRAPGRGGPDSGPDSGETAEGAGGLLGGLRRGSQLRPLLIFAASTVAAGVVV
jgi:MFS family permease